MAAQNRQWKPAGASNPARKQKPLHGLPVPSLATQLAATLKQIARDHQQPRADLTDGSREADNQRSHEFHSRLADSDPLAISYRLKDSLPPEAHAVIDQLLAPSQKVFHRVGKPPMLISDAGLALLDIAVKDAVDAAMSAVFWTPADPENAGSTALQGDLFGGA